MADKEIEMDPETGLPKLGPGMHWRVREGIARGIHVELVQSITILTRKTFEFLFWNIEYGPTEEHKSETVISGEQVTTEEGVIVTLETLTRGLILKTANRIVRNMRKKTDGILLLGDYPPKSLVKEEN